VLICSPPAGPSDEGSLSADERQVALHPGARIRSVMGFTKSTRRSRRQIAAGFTLIELMIVLVVLAVLAAVALPAYQDSVRKGRRSDAFQALSAVQMAQERWRSNHADYAKSLDDLKIATTTAGGHYTLSLDAPRTAADAWRFGYRVTATASGAQASDTKCRLLAVEVDGGIVRNGSPAAAGTAIDWSDPNRCWAR
jgi:type IV pilus assembly protein PilE